MRGGDLASRLAAGALVLLAAATTAGAAPVRAEAAWPKPTRESRPWTRWWWLGSAVDEANLTRQLEQLAAAGFGGVEICPIYGAKGWEDRYVPFLSPRWMELLAHTTREAQRLGLGVDLTTGTGWPFGGPWVGDADASSSLVLKRDERGVTRPRRRARPEGEARRARRGGQRPRPVLGRRPSSGTSRASTRRSRASRACRRAPTSTTRSSTTARASRRRSWTEFEARRGYDLRDAAPGARRRGPGGHGRAGEERLPRDALRPPPRVRPPLDAPGPTPAAASRATRRTARPATSSISTPPRTSRRPRCSGSRTRRRCRG